MVRLNNELEIEIDPRPPNEFGVDLDPSGAPRTMENRGNQENQESVGSFHEFAAGLFSDSEDKGSSAEDTLMVNGGQGDEVVELAVRPKNQLWEFYKVRPGNGAGGYGRANRDWEAEERVEKAREEEVFALERAEELRAEEEQERAKQHELRDEEERVKLQKEAEEKARVHAEQEKQKEKPPLYRQIVDQKLQGREISIVGTGVEAGAGTINQSVASGSQQNQSLQINNDSQPSRSSLRERRLQRPSSPQPVRRIDAGSNFIVHEPQQAGIPDKIDPYPNERILPPPMSIRVPEHQRRPDNPSPSRLSLPNSPILPIPSPTERRFNDLDPADAQAFLGLGINSLYGINTLCGVDTPNGFKSPLHALGPDWASGPAPANIEAGRSDSEGKLEITDLIDLCQQNKEGRELQGEVGEEARAEIRRYNTLRTVLSILRSRDVDDKLPSRLKPGSIEEIQKQWNHKDRIIFHKLAVNQIKRAGTEIEMPIFPDEVPRGSPMRVENMDSRGCNFCLYECDWGVADPRILLSPEHATGYCEPCDKRTISSERAWFDTMDSNLRFAGTKQPREQGHMITEERYKELKDLTKERPSGGAKSMAARSARRDSVGNPSATGSETSRQNSLSESSQPRKRNPLQEIRTSRSEGLGAYSTGQLQGNQQRSDYAQVDGAGDQDQAQGQLHQQSLSQGAYQFIGVGSETLHPAIGVGPEHTPQELARYEFAFSSPDEQRMSLRGGAGEVLPQESDEDDDEPSFPPKMTKSGGKPPLPQEENSGSRPQKQKITKNGGKPSQPETNSSSAQKKTKTVASKPPQVKKGGSRQPKLTKNGGKPPLSSPAPTARDEPAPIGDAQTGTAADEEGNGAILYQVKRSYGQNGNPATPTTGPRKPAAASRRKPKAAAAREKTTGQVPDDEEDKEGVENTMVRTSASKQSSGLSQGNSPVAPPARPSRRRGSNSSVAESPTSDFPPQKEKAREQTSTPANPSTKKRGPQGTLFSEPPHKIRNPDRKPDDRRIGPNKKETEDGQDPTFEAPERYVPYFDIHSGLDKDQKKSFIEDGRSAAKEHKMPSPHTLDDVTAQGLIPIPALIPRRLKHNQDEEAAYRGFWGWRYEHQQIAKRTGKSFQSLVQDGVDFMVEPVDNDVPNPSPKGNDPAGYAIARSSRDIAMAAISPVLPSSVARPPKNQASPSRGAIADSNPVYSSSPLVRKNRNSPNQPTSSPPGGMARSGPSPSAPRRDGNSNLGTDLDGSSPIQKQANQMGSSLPGDMAGFSEAQRNTGFGADRGGGSPNGYPKMSTSPYENRQSLPKQTSNGGFQQTMPSARIASRPNVGSKIPNTQSTPQALNRTPPAPSLPSSATNPSAQTASRPRPQFTPQNAPRNPSGLRYSQVASPILPPHQPQLIHVGPQNHIRQQHSQYFQQNQFLPPPQLAPFPPIPQYMPYQQYDEFLRPGPPPQLAQNLENQENIPPVPPYSPPPQFSTTPGHDDNPKRDGILLCHGSPYGQIDVTKARICEHCRTKKLEIINHRHYNFVELNKLGHDASGHVNVGLEEGRKMRNCMICPSQAYWHCHKCPLRVCESCKVLLVSQCKGLVENLLKWHFKGHVRNDVRPFSPCLWSRG